MEIPIWGVVEPQHLHINNHFNFVFHGIKGRIVGASIYSGMRIARLIVQNVGDVFVMYVVVRDAFQVVMPGSMFAMHGPVKWFRAGSFTPFGASHLGDLEFSLGTVIWVGFLSAASALLAAAVGGVAWYRYYQRPQLMRNLVKVKSN
jgi:hypothetical protein